MSADRSSEWMRIERAWAQIEFELEARGGGVRRCPEDAMLSDKIGHFNGDGVYKCRWCNAVWIEA